MSQKEVNNGVVRVYVAGADPEQMTKIKAFCQDQGFHCHPTKGFGRKRGNYPINFVLDALRSGRSIWATAKIFGLSPGTVKRIKDGDIS